MGGRGSKSASGGRGSKNTERNTVEGCRAERRRGQGSDGEKEEKKDSSSFTGTARRRCARDRGEHSNKHGGGDEGCRAEQRGRGREVEKEGQAPRQAEKESGRAGR